MSIWTALALVGSLASGVSPEDQERARELSHQSIIEYNGGEFEKALADIQQAYDLAPLPGLLFNLGQCHRALEHWKKAKFFYEGYLREVPKAGNRKAVQLLLDEVNQKVHELEYKEAQAAAAARAPLRTEPVVPIVLSTPQPAPHQRSLFDPAVEAEAPPPPSHKGRTAGWVLGGVGLGSAVAGSFLGYIAQGVFNANAPCGPGFPSGSVCYTSTTKASFDTAGGEAVAADVLWAVGGALVVTGVVLLLTSH